MNLLSEMDEKELFRRLRLGDEEAFAGIYNSYHRLLYLFALKYLGNREMAEDAVQQVFVHLWEVRTDVWVATSLKSYLYAMVRNYVLNQIRNEHTAWVKNYEIVQSAPDYEDDLEEKLERKELLALLNKAIAGLPEQKRAVCLLKIQGKYTNQEIAEKLNISVNTVKTHYLQSIRKLKESMENMLIIVIFVTLLLSLSVR